MIDPGVSCFERLILVSQVYGWDVDISLMFTAFPDKPREDKLSFLIPFFICNFFCYDAYVDALLYSLREGWKGTGFCKENKYAKKD